MRKPLALLLSLFFSLGMAAQTEISELEGEYLYYADRYMSEKDARFEAVNYARVQKLAEAFGTIVDNYGYEDSREHAFLLSSNEVKGEWIADIEEPRVEWIERQADGINVYKARVHFKARPIGNSVNFRSTVLRNGVEEKFESSQFKTGDDMYVSFESPVDGYIAIYLVDESHNAFRLLPYQADGDGEQPVKGGRRYVFFAPKENKTDVREVDELYMTCANGVIELNRLYVIFSPNRFTIENDRKEGEVLPRQLKQKDFNQWLSRSMSRDERMGRIITNLRIEAKE